jgi:hypothetical protein
LGPRSFLLAVTRDPKALAKRKGRNDLRGCTFFAPETLGRRAFGPHGDEATDQSSVDDTFRIVFVNPIPWPDNDYRPYTVANMRRHDSEKVAGAFPGASPFHQEAALTPVSPAARLRE